MTNPSETKLVETPRCDAVQADMEQSANPIQYRHHKYLDLARQLERELASLADELRLTREDADRYRWLKEHHLQTGTDTWIRTGDDLEDAIDAALKDAASSGPKES